MMILTRRARVVAAVTVLLVAAGTLAPVVGPAAADPVGDPGRGGGPLFDPLPEFEPPTGARARVSPDDFSAFDVRVGDVRARLADAPSPRRARRGAALSRITLPDPDGEPVPFEVQRTRVAEAGFEAAHPELRTWRGVAVDDPTTRLALDVTPMGLHAFVRRSGATRSWFIDPAENRRGATEHLSYYGSDVDAVPFDFRPPLGGPRGGPQAGEAPLRAARTAPGAEVPLRTYRLALVTDPTYAEYFGPADVDAEKVTLMNRVNQIYTDDFAVRMLLVDETEQLNLATPAQAKGADGPCGASGCYTEQQLSGCSVATVQRNTFVLGQIIGADDYDIGHLALGKDGGGLGGLAVVGDARKAEGCTGLPFPTGDFFAVDYVAHEMGHQFAAEHTFNGTLGACWGPNRNQETSVEPGSGSSVMAYSGICGQDDLQPHTDPYFSQRSLDEVDGHVTGELLAFDEVQTVALSGWDTTEDIISLSVPGQMPVEIGQGSADYSVTRLAEIVEQLTGFLPTVAGYDGAAEPTADGFELTFEAPDDGAGTDVPTIQVATVAGDVTGSTGVQVQGGPSTNRGVASTSGNHAPEVTAPADQLLPVRTPFTLTGSGSDVDGDELVYLWEQNDVGLDPDDGVGLATSARSNGPLFRVFPTAALVSLDDSLEYESPGQNIAGTSPTRTFPDLEQILTGNTNADTGSCPTATGEEWEPLPLELLACYSELLPTSSYVGDPSGEGSVLNFRLTARDHRLEGGGTGYDDVTLALDTTAGPFRIDSHDTTGGPRQVGTSETLTWEVNGTDNYSLATHVRILLSEDGGLTFDHVLAESTPNDGSAQITWPDVTSDAVRLKVEAVDNYFFDINDADLSVSGSDETPPNTWITSGPGQLVASWAATFGYESNEAGTYRCRLDGSPVACGAGTVQVRGLSAGPHRFEVSAVDQAGNEDPTPSVRRFAVAYDDRQLRRDGDWQPRSKRQAFRGTYLQTWQRGSRAWRWVGGGNRVGVVVGTGPGFGKVDVLVRGERIRRIDLDGPWRLRKLITLPARATTSGRYTIRSRGGGRVRVDGLAVFQP